MNHPEFWVDAVAKKEHLLFKVIEQLFFSLKTGGFCVFLLIVTLVYAFLLSLPEEELQENSANCSEGDATEQESGVEKPLHRFTE